MREDDARTLNGMHSIPYRIGMAEKMETGTGWYDGLQEFAGFVFNDFFVTLVNRGFVVWA